MVEDWKTYSLGQVVNLITGKLNSNQAVENGQYPFFTCSPITLKINKYAFDQEAILLAGNNANAVYSIKHFVGKFNAYQRTYVIDSKMESINLKFLFYVLWLRINYLKDISQGTATKFLTMSLLNNIEISVPPFSEQRLIASILSTIDDKIELNLQMNKTLEEMAMTLYKHWFVDFGPFQEGEFVESELGMIPKGWEVKPIGDLIETLGGGTPKTDVNEYWENGTLDWYSPTDLTKANSLFSLGSAKKINELGLQKSSSKLFPKGSLLMSSRATIGAITINRKEACTNQGFITMIPNKTLSLFQLHGWTVHNMELIISKANGSTFKEISKSNFRSIPIVVGECIEDYLKNCNNIYSQIENNILENDTLTTLRDTLLPKLISGEVRVKEAIEILEEVM